jgi:hypothetical protein
MLSGCSVSSLAARFAFFPPEPATYAVRKDEATGRLVASGVTGGKKAFNPGL